MRRRGGRAVAAYAAVSLSGLAVMPAAAPASVTLGQTCSPNATSQLTTIQTATAAGVPGAQAPFTGVIASFFQSRPKVFHEASVGCLRTLD